MLQAESATPSARPSSPRGVPRAGRGGDGPGLRRRWRSEVTKVTPVALRNLTGTAGVGEFDPSWAPDDSQILFSRSGDLYVMDADGSGVAQLLAARSGNSRTTYVLGAADWAP